MRRRLGVNIDHIATLREARGVRYPDPVDSLPILKACRADQVTIHLREDRRHIRDPDLARIVAAKVLPVNLEMAAAPEIVAIARRTRPATVTFVPEKRREVTTEGGLDCIKYSARVGRAAAPLKAAGIRVSLFIDPDPRQLKAALNLGADAVELHTGAYCEEWEKAFARAGHGRHLIRHPKVVARLREIKDAAKFGRNLGLDVFAGHGLNADNLAPVAAISEIEEYNIGHAIVARAVFVGLAEAIREIQAVLWQSDGRG